MKIVMLQDFFGLDCSYQENLLTEYYVKLGHDVTVLSSTFESIFDYVNDKYDKNKAKEEIRYKGSKIIRLPYSLNILNKIRKHSGIYKILLEEKPDLIYVHDIHFNIPDAVKYAKKHTGVKIIMDFHADYSNSANSLISLLILHKIIRKFFLRKYVKHISKFFPITPASGNFLSEVYGINKEDMELLPLGCDYYKSIKILDTIDKSLTKSLYNISPEDFVIITGGKITREKNTHILIEVIEKLSEVKKNIKLIVFGSAPANKQEYLNEIKKKATSLPVIFTGWIDNNKILELMAISDLAVYPSSQSVLWQQSIGMKLPLIVGDAGDQSAEYLNLHNNLIVLKKDKISHKFFLKEICHLMENSSKLLKMSNGAALVARDYISYEYICKKTLSVCES